MAILVILLMVFGMDLLVNFSLLVKKSTGADIKKDELSYVAPPVLNPTLDATKSATIILSGYAQDKQTVKLYVNGKFVDKKAVQKDKQFVFPSVELEKGSNEIKAKATTDDNKESNYSTPINVTYIDSPPALEVSFPQDGQTISKGDGPIKITGKSDVGIRITVNDFWAITEDDGSFSYSLSLHDGDNIIKIVALDAAGNQTTKEIKVIAN
jgi:bacillopeptidase F